MVLSWFHVGVYYRAGVGEKVEKGVFMNVIRLVNRQVEVLVTLAKAGALGKEGIVIEDRRLVERFGGSIPSNMSDLKYCGYIKRESEGEVGKPKGWWRYFVRDVPVKVSNVKGEGIDEVRHWKGDVLAFGGKLLRYVAEEDQVEGAWEVLERPEVSVKDTNKWLKSKGYLKMREGIVGMAGKMRPGEDRRWVVNEEGKVKWECGEYEVGELLGLVQGRESVRIGELMEMMKGEPVWLFEEGKMKERRGRGEGGVDSEWGVRPGEVKWAVRLCLKGKEGQTVKLVEGVCMEAGKMLLEWEISGGKIDVEREDMGGEGWWVLVKSVMDDLEEEGVVALLPGELYRSKEGMYRRLMDFEGMEYRVEKEEGLPEVGVAVGEEWPDMEQVEREKEEERKRDIDELAELQEVELQQRKKREAKGMDKSGTVIKREWNIEKMGLGVAGVASRQGQLAVNHVLEGAYDLCDLGFPFYKEQLWEYLLRKPSTGESFKFTRNMFVYYWKLLRGAGEIQEVPPLRAVQGQPWTALAGKWCVVRRKRGRSVFRVSHWIKRKTVLVLAKDAEEACRIQGWDVDKCRTARVAMGKIDVRPGD